MNRTTGKWLASILVSALLATGCGQSNGTPATANNAAPMDGFVQTVTLVVDGKKIALALEDILSMSYVKPHLLMGVMSQKNDLQFSFAASLPELTPGTYQAYDCKSASECDEEMDGKNLHALLAPLPKDPMPPLSSSRIAYYAPSLGLQPLAVTVTSVADEQQEGAPTETKRVKGTFNGTLVYVERQDAGWKVVGMPTKVEGEFDLYCGIR